MITQFQNNSYRWSPAAIALIVTLCCISLPNARSGQAAQPASTSVSAKQPTLPIVGESDVFVDPNTGIRFTKVKTLSGTSDVINDTTDLQISPNGKLLSFRKKVVPLDGGQPFDLVDIPKEGSGSAPIAWCKWSPDGQKLVVYNSAPRAIFVVPVNPETGHPTGPAENLPVEGKGPPNVASMHWSDDSEKIIFNRLGDKESPGLWSIAIKDKSLSQIADPASVGRRSPDGKHVAFVEIANGQMVLSVKSTEGGPATKVTDGGRPILWSANSDWLLYCAGRNAAGFRLEEPRFFRSTDGRKIAVTLPARATVVGVSAGGKKLLCYRPSYELRHILEVVSVSGGPPAELGRQMRYKKAAGPYCQFWSPDSKSIIVEGQCEGDDTGLWALSLSGSTPVSLKMDVSVPGSIQYRQLSPNLDYVLFISSTDDRTYDLWGAPVSWKQMRTTGPAVLVFKNWAITARKGSLIPGIWSPDGKRVAFVDVGKGEIWLGSLEGGEPARLSELTRIPGPGLKGWPVWSPDGSMLAFNNRLSDAECVIQVISASGGEAKTLAHVTGGVGRGQRVFGGFGEIAWSPDGKALTMLKRFWNGPIWSVSVSDGQSQPLVSVQEVGEDSSVSNLHWSPDGKILAFQGGIGTGSGLLLFHRQDGHITRLASSSYPYFDYFWSPDSKWISLGLSRVDKTRPEGVLWEMDIEEAVAKLTK